jgi:SpoVK/Ycf46/Vps4 family AAA+-type ATPase
VEDVLDDLALKSGLTAFRYSEGALLLDGPGVFVRAYGWRKAGYASLQFLIWADGIGRANELRDMLFGIVGERLAPEQLFTIDWHFVGGGRELTSTSSEELLTEDLHDEAYPTVPAPLSAFIERYLDANETVLVLQGPPGTGKTRLVRAILGAMSRRKGETAEVMYTADKRALEADEIFVRFITGSHDAFVIEDADHLLLARANGNHDLHRFLTVADGVVRAQGRKIIFTTNLPNVSDMDEALLRPGRCFANVRTRLLTREEAALLAKRVLADQTKVDSVLDALFAATKSASVAHVYRGCSVANGVRGYVAN